MESFYPSKSSRGLNDQIILTSIYQNLDIVIDKKLLN
jgi:hypothetical protein